MSRLCIAVASLGADVDEVEVWIVSVVVGDRDRRADRRLRDLVQHYFETQLRSLEQLLSVLWLAV